MQKQQNNKKEKIIASALSLIAVTSALSLNLQAKENLIIGGTKNKTLEIETNNQSHDLINYDSYDNVAKSVESKFSLKEHIPIYLDGQVITEFNAYLINEVTYVPLRAFCNYFSNCNITWNGRNNTATVRKSGFYLSARVGTKYIVVNDRYFYTVNPILNIEGRLYVPIRPMAKAFAIDLSWDSVSRSVNLKETHTRVKWASEVYKEDDVYWLSRIINAESGGEPFDGKIAVGNVVLNRVKSPLYPNTIYGVIFDRRHGTQFSPVAFGTIYNDPNVSSVIAAKICLEGYSITDKALFFLNPRIATNHWIEANCKYEFTIGTHDFYS